MTEQQNLADMAGELAGMLQIEKRMLDDLKAHQADIAEARRDLHEAMQAHGTKGVTHSHVKITRRQGTRLTVTSRLQLEAALKEVGAYEQCLNPPTLNVEAAKKLAVAREMPGVERQPYDELSVKIVNQLT